MLTPQAPGSREVTVRRAQVTGTCMPLLYACFAIATGRRGKDMDAPAGVPPVALLPRGLGLIGAR